MAMEPSRITDDEFDTSVLLRFNKVWFILFAPYQAQLGHAGTGCPGELWLSQPWKCSRDSEGVQPMVGGGMSF